MKRISAILILVVTGLQTVLLAAIIPMPNVTVSLKSTGTPVYTDTNGLFTLGSYTGRVIKNQSNVGINHVENTMVQKNTMNIVGSNLYFEMSAPQNIRIDIYNIKGQKLVSPFNRHLEAGSYALQLNSLLSPTMASGICVVKIHKGDEELVHTLLPGARNGSSHLEKVNGSLSKNMNALSKIAAGSDSIVVYKMGYVTRTLPITTLAGQNFGDIEISLTAEEIAVAKKVDSVLALMTINEKAGQMTQVQINPSGTQGGYLTDAQVASLCIGSVFNGSSNDGSAPGNTPVAWATIIDRVQNVILTSARLKIPMLYGQDCVHGVGGPAGCTVLPHNIGLGCTRDTALVAKMGRITAEEAAGIGIRFNFAPCVAPVRNEKWGRTYEGFGEIPELNCDMGLAYVRGQQGYGDISKVSAIAVSVKHFMGDGGTTNGTNSGTTSLSDTSMRALHFAPYVTCARENMSTIMPSYSTWSRPGGVSFKMSIDSIAITKMLKRETGFDGFAISDWDAVGQLSGGYSDANIAKSINAGMDMGMTTGGTNPSTWINSIVKQAGGAIPMSRIDDAVRRILRIKFRMHLQDHPKSDPTLRSQIFSAEHQSTAREAVRKSLVLLKNDSTNGVPALPLKRTEKIVVVGAYANSMGIQCGGWTTSWQGNANNPTVAGQTILAGMKLVGDSTQITYDATGANLSAADKIVVVVGESPYAEGNGDNLNSLDLTNTNNAGTLITTCFNSGKPVIVVLLSGRPLIIDGEITKCKAFVAAWLPGSMGKGVADVLYGDYNFTGTLSHTWPVSAAQIPINAGRNFADEQHGSGGTPQYPFGYGLHY